MSFFKSNTTTTTNATENTANQETGNNNGGILKGVAIAVGTVAGIGLAAFGGKKAYNHFHVKDENNMEDVSVNDDDEENVEEETSNTETVESFNEVETEEPANEAPVEAKEAKTEETKNETHAEDEKPSTASLVDQMEKEASVFEKDMILPIEIKMAIEQMDYLMSCIAQCNRTIGDNARTASAIRKLQNGVKDFWLDMGRGICSQKFHPENLEDLFAKDIDLIDKAYFEMKYINKSDLVLGVKDSTVEMYNRLVRLANKQKQASNEKQVDAKSVGETQTTENCFDVFKDGHKENNKVERETKSPTKKVTGETKTVTKASNKKQPKAKASKTVDALAADPIKTAGETKTADSVVDETRATTEEVPSETQIGNATVNSDDDETITLKSSVSEDSVQNVMDVIDIVSKIPNREDPEKNDMPYFIRVIGGRIAGITEPEATFLAYNDKTKSNDFIDACVSLCNMVGNGICNLADQKSNPIGSLGWINRSYDELIASGVIDNTYNPQAMRDALTKARNEATRVLTDMVKKSSDETQDEVKSSGETKTEETLTYTMSEKIQEAVQQSDETAATAEPESASQAPMSPEASSLAAKLQEVGELMRAEKWSDAAEFYKTQLTPYLADDGLSKELRDEIMGIKTKATNMLMSQKQLEAKQKAANTKASKKSSKRRRRH